MDFRVVMAMFFEITLFFDSPCRYIFLSIAEMGDSFRDAAWDNQLDTMLDDLQASVQAGGSETHGYKNGYHSANGGKIGLY